MGTRGAYGFRIDGEDKITYSQYDSYPSGLGRNVLEFIVDTPIDEMVDIARGIEMVEGDTKATMEQVNECIDYFDSFNGLGDPTDWYCLLYHSQGDLRPYRNKAVTIRSGWNLDTMEPIRTDVKGGLKYMLQSKMFLLDSLSCEWAYIINLDTKVLEIYRGRNKNKNAAGRYAGFNPNKAGASVLKEEDFLNVYYGVSLINDAPLEDITKMDPALVVSFCEKLEQSK